MPPGRLPSERAMLFFGFAGFFSFFLCSARYNLQKVARLGRLNTYTERKAFPPPLFSTPSGCFWCCCLLPFVPPPGDVLLYCIVHMLQCGSGAEEGVREMHCVSGWNTNLEKVKNEVREIFVRIFPVFLLEVCQLV